MPLRELPVPAHFDADRVGEIWKVDYAARARDAGSWRRVHAIAPAADDRFRVALLAVDVQNTFCQPDFELFVRGRSGIAAVDDCRRLCSFLYRNLAVVTRILPTLDTHQALQIFHAAFFVGPEGEQPEPHSQISVEDVEAGRWRIAPRVAELLGLDRREADDYLLHYTRSLAASGKYALTVWPYHAMLGGIGHALVPAVEEAFFFHSIARSARLGFQIKGAQPLTEHYSILGPEVTDGPRGEPIGGRNETLVDELLGFDAVVVAGQAKSHCVAWTIADLLSDIEKRAGDLARRVYLLADCTSPVVVPGAADYTEQADAAFRRFSDAGMHVVASTDPIASWPGIAPAVVVGPTTHE